MQTCKTCAFYTSRKTAAGTLHRCSRLGAGCLLPCDPEGACIHPSCGWKPREERPVHQNREFWWLDNGEPLAWEGDD
jgi:hypothetical protein